MVVVSITSTCANATLSLGNPQEGEMDGENQLMIGRMLALLQVMEYFLSTIILNFIIINFLFSPGLNSICQSYQ